MCISVEFFFICTNFFFLWGRKEILFFCARKAFSQKEKDISLQENNLKSSKI